MPAGNLYYLKDAKTCSRISLHSSYIKKYNAVLNTTKSRLNVPLSLDVQGIRVLGLIWLLCAASYAINLVECLDRNKAEELIACYRSADVAAAAQLNAAS